MIFLPRLVFFTLGLGVVGAYIAFIKNPQVLSIDIIPLE